MLESLWTSLPGVPPLDSTILDDECERQVGSYAILKELGAGEVSKSQASLKSHQP